MKRVVLLLLLLMPLAMSRASGTYCVTFSLDDYEISTGDDGLTRVVPKRTGAFYSDDRAMPALPYSSYNILRPRGCVTTYTVDFDKLLLRDDVVMAANPVCVPADAIPLVDAGPEAAVSSLLQPVRFAGNKVLSGYYYSSFNITPFLYDAATRSLYFVPSVTLRLSGTDAGGELPPLRHHNDDFIKEIVMNPEELQSLYPVQKQTKGLDDGTSIGVEYYIITSEKLAPYFEPLAAWRNRSGTRTEIVTREEIYDEYTENTSQMKIKTFLKDRYSGDCKNLKWALLGGDKSVIPAQGVVIKYDDAYYDEAPCDLFYGCFEDPLDWDADRDHYIGELNDNIDLSPEVFVSRAPLSTPEEVSAFVNKVLKYEMHPNETGYVDKMLFVGCEMYASFGGKSDAQCWGEKMYDGYVDDYWDGQLSYYYDTGNSFGSKQPLDGDKLRELIDGGYHVVHETSHGKTGSWDLGVEKDSSDDYEVADAIAQTNSNASIVISAACKANDFDDAGFSCLGTALLRNTSGGSLACLGSSRESWVSAGSPSLGPSHRHDADFMSRLLRGKRLATAAAQAKTATFTSTSGYSIDRFLTMAINLFGDAPMLVHTGELHHFDNVDVRVQGTDVTVTVDGVDDCVIALTSRDGGKSYFSRSTEGNHYAFHNVDVPFYVTVTKQNYVPYLYPAEDVYIQDETFTDEVLVDGGDVYVGHDVTTSSPEGDVVVKSGARLVIDADGEVLIKNGFTCEDGAVLEIK